MLEVRNLKKVYRVKNGDPVYALNDVSIKFPEKGLVFILGKSGSGKSTLLNVIGGLDVPDEGEIIIDGKSSKEFTKGELDSYRNTYLGFIFQEYNILNDFTVKENIALALELQHKKATDEIIDNILKEVDLVGFGKRKPNELSGGQKQRVAIARALVKEPKIIFGDEPTGALDSNTGKQVFETLKNLSKDKLVVVVSHDREFAEHFGDRVIELKDGVIISDLEKKPTKNVTPTEGLSILGENVIRISKDHKLTEKDLSYINDAIDKAEDDIYIVADSNVNKAVCQAAKIDADGKRNSFTKTNEDDIKGDNEEFKTIKSRFSLWQAFRMGARSIKVKPFRLVMTVLLSTVSFSLFGASLTLSMFSSHDALTSSIKQNSLNLFYANVKEQGTQYGFSDERIDEINSTGAKAYGTRTISSLSLERGDGIDSYHLTSWSSSLKIKDSFLADFGFTLYSGDLPKEDGECAISYFAYQTFEDFGYRSKDGETVIPANEVTADKIIGKTLNVTFQGQSKTKTYTIKGIVDTKVPESLAKYRKNPTSVNSQSDDYGNVLALSAYNSIHAQIFLPNVESEEELYVVSDFGNSKSAIKYSPYITNTFFFDKSKTELGDKEAFTSLATLGYEAKAYPDILPEGSNFVTKYDEITKEFEADISSYIDANYETLFTKYINNEKITEEKDKKEAVENYIFSTSTGRNTEEYISFMTSFRKKEVSILNEVNSFPTLVRSGDLETKAGVNETVSINVVGLELESDPQTMTNTLAVSKSYATNLINTLKAAGSYNYNYNKAAFISLKGANIDSFVNFYSNNKSVFTNNYENDIPNGSWCLDLNNATITNVEMMSMVVLVLTHVFIYIGIALAIFSMLLFYNFISVSINNKKREIGILRAVGAKRMDVFKIFYSEAFIIAFLNFLLSTVLVFVISFLVNKEIMKDPAFQFSLMNPNFLVVLALLGISIGCSIISALLPVIRIANKKPIDAIQNR